MVMKKKMVVLMAVLVLALSACSGGAVEFTDNAYAAELAAATTEEASTAVSVVQTASDTGTSASTEEAAETAVAPVSGEYDSDDLEPSVAGADTTYVVLAGDTITLDGEGATVDGSVVTITSAGTYSVSGTLDDGQITVDTDDEETVYLILDGVEIACSTSAPIYVSNAEKTVITLADGSENSVTDGDSYVLDAESDEPNAAVFSKDDLTINGGYLYVNAGGDGLDSNGSIERTGGTVIVNGPTNDGNGPLDYLGTFNISGGLLVAVGSSGMAQAPSATRGAVSGLTGQHPGPLLSSDLDQHRVRARALAGQGWLGGGQHVGRARRLGAVRFERGPRPLDQAHNAGHDIARYAGHYAHPTLGAGNADRLTVLDAPLCRVVGMYPQRLLLPLLEPGDIIVLGVNPESRMRGDQPQWVRLCRFQYPAFGDGGESRLGVGSGGYLHATRWGVQRMGLRVGDEIGQANPHLIRTPIDAGASEFLIVRNLRVRDKALEPLLGALALGKFRQKVQPAGQLTKDIIIVLHISNWFVDLVAV